MKKIETKKVILLIFAFSIIAMFPMLINPSFVGPDAEFHFLNIRGIVNEISWNNWFVRQPLPLIARDFGYGTNFFYPPLPHLTAAYIAKILKLFSIDNILLSMRITGWLTIFFSGVTFYLLGYKIIKKSNISLLGSFFYMTAPYHLAEIYIRDAFSEMFLFISLPLIILGLLELKDGNHKRFYFYFTLGFSLSIYSHMACSIYFTLMLIVTFFLIYFKKLLNKKSILYLICSSFSILLFTAPFWLPLLEVKLSTDYTIFVPYYLSAKGSLVHSTLKISDYFQFFRPHEFSGIRHHLQFSITLLLCFSLVVLIKEKCWKRKTILFLLSFFFLSTIMTTKIFPWQKVPAILQTLQFPWRLTLTVQFTGILLSLFAFNKLINIKNAKFLFILFIAIGTVEMFYNTYHLDKTLNPDELNYDYGMGNEKEYLPHKTTQNKEYYEKRTKDILVTSGNAEVSILSNEITKLDFEVTSENPITVELPRLYYLGYELKGQEGKIKLKESMYGFIEAEIQKSGKYELSYKKTPIMKLSQILFLLNALLHLSIFFILKRKKRFQKSLVE